MKEKKEENPTKRCLNLHVAFLVVLKHTDLEKSNLIVPSPDRKASGQYS